MTHEPHKPPPRQPSGTVLPVYQPHNPQHAWDVAAPLTGLHGRRRRASRGNLLHDKRIQLAAPAVRAAGGAAAAAAVAGAAKRRKPRRGRRHGLAVRLVVHELLLLLVVVLLVLLQGVMGAHKHLRLRQHHP